MNPRPARRVLQPQQKYAPLKKALASQLILVFIISKKRAVLIINVLKIKIITQKSRSGGTLGPPDRPRQPPRM